MPRTTRPTPGQIAEGLGALCVIIAGLVGIPIVLATLVGWPLPHHLPTLVQLKTDMTTQIPDAFWPKCFGVLGWIAWAHLVYSVTMNLVDQVRARRRRGYAGHAARGLAGALITAILLLGQVRATPSAPGFSPTPVVQVIAAPPAVADAQPAEVVHTVVEGESLWEIAVAYYGNGEMWKEICAANRGVRQPDGRALATANWIYPGWQLVIPNAPGSGPLTPVVRGVPGLRPLAVRTGVTPTSSSPSSTPSPAPVASPAPSAPRPSGIGDRHAIVRAPGDHPDRSPHQASFLLDVPDLPESAIGGLGVLAAAVIARSLRRRRRIARVRLRPYEMIAASSPEVRDLETALAALVDTPVVDWLDLAMRHLTELDVQERRVVPKVRLIRVGNHGVDLVLSRAHGVAAGAFCVTEDGWAWSLPSTTDPAVLANSTKFPAWYSSLVPVGEDEDGQTYLVPVEPGTVLPVTGVGADDVVAAMAVTAGSWSWADQVTVTTDPIEAAAASQSIIDDPSRSWDRVLYRGSPADLWSGLASRIGILTTDDAVATDLSVKCCSDATVEIVPTGLRLGACRLGPAARAGIEEAVATAETPPSTEIPEYQVLLDAFPATSASTFLSGATGSPDSGVPELEVRILTSSPTITGLREPAVFRDKDRRFELLALLGLCGGLTKEEIRASMYGSTSSVDNITRIARNTRSMLGDDVTGQSYLPWATETGLHTLSPRVTTDFARLFTMVREAEQAEPGAAIGLYVSALDLIDAAPGVPIDHAWSWWFHYAGSAQKVALEAASALGRLTVDTGGDMEVVRRGINQARALAPFAEELYRLAIEMAGVAGNLGWAQREWEELRRMLDDLCPGTAPSPETEAAYRAVMQPTRTASS